LDSMTYVILEPRNECVSGAFRRLFDALGSSISLIS
jgi:hypothetical protein